MTMVSSGPISLAGTATSGGLNESIEVELGGSGSSTISLNDSSVRTLLVVPSGAIDLHTAYGKSSFTPFNQSFTSGSGTVTVPTGASGLTVYVVGGGGKGGDGWAGVDPGGGGGGGSGGFSAIARAISSGDWGVTLSYIVGAGSSSGSEGGTSSSSGSVAAGSLIQSATGGFVGANGNPGGGTGGSGGAPAGSSGAAGGAGSGGIGGTGGAAPLDSQGGGGNGGHVSGFQPGFNGVNGLVKFAWT